MTTKAIKRWARFGLFTSLAVIGGMFLRRCERFAIPVTDQSLAPTYPAGSRVVCIVLDEDDGIERDTDVVYKMEWEGVMVARFGRVRGLPGDEMGVDEKGRITVNGVAIGPIGLRGEPLGTVPPGTLCILAINPQEVTYPDSRKNGFVSRADVRARIVARWGMSGGP